VLYSDHIITSMQLEGKFVPALPQVILFDLILL
jgi:hypothetical protein